MGALTVYDKVSWHYPDGNACPSLEAATKHFKQITNWLQTHGMLTELGQELTKFGIDADFSLTSELVTKEGKSLLDSNYEKWVATLNYGDESGIESWEKLVNETNRG